jgi:hypothetical protein
MIKQKRATENQIKDVLRNAVTTHKSPLRMSCCQFFGTDDDPSTTTSTRL